MGRIFVWLGQTRFHRWLATQPLWSAALTFVMACTLGFLVIGHKGGRTLSEFDLSILIFSAFWGVREGLKARQRLLSLSEMHTSVLISK